MGFRVFWVVDKTFLCNCLSVQSGCQEAAMQLGCPE